MMTKFITILLVACLLVNSPLLAQSADEKQIADRVEMLRKALMTPDKAILEDLAADDLSYGHSSGLIENKAAFMEALLSGKSKLSNIAFPDQTVKITGDIAVVRHKMTGDVDNNGTISKVDIFVLLVWQKQKGKWKILARQAAKKPA